MLRSHPHARRPNAAIRVLFVGHTAALGGAELSLLGMVPHFSERCHVALLADGPLRVRLEQAGIGVTVLASDPALLAVSRQGGRANTLRAAPATARVAWRLAAMARAYDVLFPNSQKAAVVCFLAGAMLRKPVVWYLHDILSASHFSRLQRRVVVGLANVAASRVLVNSQASRDAFVASGGRQERVRIVFNGIDPAPFDAVSDAQAAALRRSMGFQDKQLVGVFGRLTYWKGQHILIEALARLPDIHAIIVGDALFGEQDYAATLRDRADSLGVSGRISWLGFRDDVPALMRMVDLVLHTSVSPEPFGRVIVEAMLARRPVLATDHGGAVELLGPAHEHLVKPGDPDALAAAIARCLATEADHAAGVVATNRARALTHFSASGMVRDIDRHIAEAAG